MDTLTQRITSLRELKNISKAEMSRILDLDPSNYNKYEKTGRDWTISQIEKIASALGVSVVELLTGEKGQQGGQIKATESDGALQERLLLFFKNSEKAINNKYIMGFIEKAWADMKAEKIPPEAQTGYYVKYAFDVSKELDNYLITDIEPNDIGGVLVISGLVTKETLLEAFNRLKNVIPPKYKKFIDDYLRDSFSDSF